MASRALLFVFVLFAGTFLAYPPAAKAVDPAPAWNLTDVDGNNVSSAALLGQIVVLEFSGTWCLPCKIVEAGFKDLHTEYAGEAVVFLGVFISPQNSLADVAGYRDSRSIPWAVAADDNDTVASLYSIAEIPRILIIDRQGFLVFDWTAFPGFNSCDVQTIFRTQIDRAIQGDSTPISLTTLSIPVLLIVAAFLSFFSPCSFPVLPAFMAYFLKLDSQGTKATTGAAAGRGFLASLGIVTVYGIIALAVLAAGAAAAAFIPFINPVMGVVLITFGILALLPFQYHWMTRPFIALKNRIVGAVGGKWEPGVGTKLFAFGAGYGAAGFACVAPPFIGAVLAASAIGSTGLAAIGLLLYVAIVVLLMVGVTVALHIAGDRALKKIRVWSAAMKYISAAALIIAGAYLLYLFVLAYFATGC